MVQDEKEQNGSSVCHVGKPELRRFHILTILIVQQIVNTMLWISFAPIAREMSEFYHVHIQWINTLSAVCLFLFPVGMVWCSYLTARCGLRQAIVIAAALNLLSGLLRYASTCLPVPGHIAYAILLVGQIVSAFAQPIFTNTPVRVANEWFPQNERDLATTVGNVGFGLGNVVGLCLPSLIVFRDPVSKEVHGIGELLVVEFVTCIVAHIWCWQCFADEPREPPSKAAAQKRKARLQACGSNAGESATSLKDVFADYATLLCDRHFVFLLVAFSIVLGAYNSMMTDLEQLLHPPGYTFVFTCHFGNSFVIAGFATSALSGMILDRTHAYRTVLKVSYFFTFLGAINFCYQLRPDNHFWLKMAGALFGAASLPLLPVTLESAAEATFPLPEEATTGLLILGGNYCGVLFTYILAALIQIAPTFETVFTPASAFICCIIGTSSTVGMFFNADYKRHAAEFSRVSSVPLLA